MDICHQTIQERRNRCNEDTVSRQTHGVIKVHQNTQHHNHQNAVYHLLYSINFNFKFKTIFENTKLFADYFFILCIHFIKINIVLYCKIWNQFFCIAMVTISLLYMDAPVHIFINNISYLCNISKYL